MILKNLKLNFPDKCNGIVLIIALFMSFTLKSSEIAQADERIATAYFEKANLCYEKVDFPCALKFYRDALEFSKSKKFKIKVFEQIIVIYHALDQTESALEMIRRIYNLENDYKPDPLFYPPKILALFREIRPKPKLKELNSEKPQEKSESSKISSNKIEKVKNLVTFDSDIQHYFGDNRLVFHNALQVSSGFLWQISGTNYFFGPRLKYYRQKKVSSNQILENFGVGMTSIYEYYNKDNWVLRLRAQGSVDFWSLNQKLTKVGISVGWEFLPGFRYKNLITSMMFGVNHYIIPSNKNDDQYVNFNSILVGLLFSFEL